jgi:hypothetical protein
VVEIAPDAGCFVALFGKVFDEGSCVFAVDRLQEESPGKATSLFQSRSTAAAKAGSLAFWWVFQ